MPTDRYEGETEIMTDKAHKDSRASMQDDLARRRAPRRGPGSRGAESGMSSCRRPAPAPAIRTDRP